MDSTQLIISIVYYHLHLHLHLHLHRLKSLNLIMDDQTIDDNPDAKRHRFKPDDTSDIPNPEEYFSKQAKSFGVHEWIQFSKFFSVDSLFEKACTYVNNHLASRLYLLGGKTMSLADTVLASSLCSTDQKWLSLLQSEKFQYLGRLYRMVSAEYLRRRMFDIRSPGKLPGAKFGEVCLRFSPKPTPLFDIQHVRAALLHLHYAVRYRGKLIICFEDTNPTKGSTEFEANLLKDLKTLGIKCDDVSYTSDYFHQLIKMAESLILRGKAYVDNTPQEQIRKEMFDGIESKCRNHSPEENMELWKEMIAGSDVGCKCYLRGKLDMQHPNNYLRDPVYYLCSPIPHRRTGTQFKVYPTNNFSCPYIDGARAVTHVLWSSLRHKSSPLYYRVLEDMGFSGVQIYEYKLLHVAYTPPSAHQLEWFAHHATH
ncbi:hypothetical protein AQUCO_02900016v1 [Aquilegia coerulea]|uniref:Glutamyl/glutaminyl-tRNA synthetase class Ib catalytic domain-containing protein n=1 Tax=Aquilegia coerulea TaxID=218851 RepID=A0A2G5D2Z4_AQUCA|nr:hypothetical protein AQUCO_02900016v1 [Aquilegia coerulea]